MSTLHSFLHINNNDYSLAYAHTRDAKYKKFFYLYCNDTLLDSEQVPEGGSHTLALQQLFTRHNIVGLPDYEYSKEDVAYLAGYVVGMNRAMEGSTV